MYKVAIAALILILSPLSNAYPVTYLLYGTAETYSFADGSVRSASDPLYRADGSMLFNGDTLAIGSLTIDLDLLTPWLGNSDQLTGGVTWTFMTEGMAIRSSYPAGNFWPLSRLTDTSYGLLDEGPLPNPVFPDNFTMSLNFEDLPFESAFIDGRFSYNNVGVQSEYGRVGSLSGRIDSLILVPQASVPEPASLSLLVAGLLGLATMRKQIERAMRRQSA